MHVRPTARAMAWLVSALALAAPSARADDIIVIMHGESTVAKVSKAELAAIFGGSKNSLGGEKVTPFNLEPKTATRASFEKVVLSMTPDQVAQHWIDKRVRGEGNPPRQIPSSAMAVRLVKSMKGAIGYVDAATALDGVRVVARIRGDQVVAP